MLIKKLSENKYNENSSLYIALGFFDGVHLGHQSVIKNAVQNAKKDNILSAVFTFDKMSIKGQRISSNDDREEEIKELGVDVIIYADFENIRDLSPLEFVNLLTDVLHCKKSFCGRNYSFGKYGSGDSALLQKLMIKKGYDTCVVDDEIVNGVLISSKLIKKSIADGELDYYRSATGREYSLHGIIEHGKGIGNKELFPTINISIEDTVVTPRFGVYSSKTIIDGEKFLSVTNVGVCPTVTVKGKTTAETFLIGVSEDLYGKYATVLLGKFVRDEKKFNSVEELKKQISKDIESVIESGDWSSYEK